MKIGFFSEIGSVDGILFPRNYPNSRTDVAWSVALNARVYNFDVNKLPDIDLAIMICPKQKPEKCFNFFNKFKGQIRFANMQEGANSNWQSYSIENQIHYLNLLMELDLIFCHNEIDQKYYQGLIPNKPVHILPSLMIEDAIPQLSRIERQNCIVGGTWSEWYSGQDSFMIAQEFNCQIYAPSMGRKLPEENQIEGIIYLPYLTWNEWLVQLSQFKFGVHLMRTYAAGTMSLNCARLKVPLIGYDQLDTQKYLFPELSVNEGDLVSARNVAKHLYKNDLFYNHVTEYAFKKYHEIYSEKIFIEEFNQNIKEIL